MLVTVDQNIELYWNTSATKRTETEDGIIQVQPQVKLFALGDAMREGMELHGEREVGMQKTKTNDIWRGIWFYGVRLLNVAKLSTSSCTRDQGAVTLHDNAILLLVYCVDE